MDRDQTKPQLRESCSLSVLNQRHLTIVKSSKSSDNLHRVVLNTTPPPLRKSSIFFNLRRSRKREKYSKKGEQSIENEAVRSKITGSCSCGANASGTAGAIGTSGGACKKYTEKIKQKNGLNLLLTSNSYSSKTDDLAQSWQTSNISSSR
ncbi:unnamed protein product [Thelazia callipaeda]|uniref:Uncharacterized protein n=1 Tax=Thelazia callipaeda TaxID=103827 RepID=A0A0N5CSV8_THECL|nr:unnamed protein product [Thelazia callipaeda]